MVLGPVLLPSFMRNMDFSLRHPIDPIACLPQSKTRTCHDLVLASTQLAEPQPGTVEPWGVLPKHRHDTRKVSSALLTTQTSEMHTKKYN